MSELIKPVIVVVGYNRTESLKRLLDSVEAATYKYGDATLIVSIDYSDSQDSVAQIAEELNWTHGEKIIRRLPENYGLRKHIISCGDFSEKYGAVLILEDDLMVAEDFYNYACEALTFYKDDDRVVGASIYRQSWNEYENCRFKPVRNEYSNYLGMHSETRGQAWTYKQWRGFKEWYLENIDKLPDYDERIPDSVFRWSKNSWGKYFVYYIVTHDKYYSIPYDSLSTNFGEVGVHNKKKTVVHQVPLLFGTKTYNFAPFEKALRYNMYFERMNFESLSAMGISEDNLLVDLNGLCHVPAKKRYMLSIHKYDFPVIKSYSMELKPIDQNIDYDIEGDDIFLYDLEGCDRNVKYHLHPNLKRRIAYELEGYWWWDFWPMLFTGIADQFRNIFGRIKRKILH